MGSYSIFPPQASAGAPEMDGLMMFQILVCVVMTALIFFCVFFFAVKYRRKDPNERPKPIHGSIPIEVMWSILPFLVMLVMFAWGTKLYLDSVEPPRNSLDIYVTGKQWMWKVQYPEGQREINELHIPTGRPVKLTLASEDVIHSFFIPAFRVKHDVVPGHYEEVWFTATKPGRYHLFCAEYCGTQHSTMTGWVTVMDPVSYEAWLSSDTQGGSMADQGEKLFEQYGCATCHLSDKQARYPTLRNVYGHPVSIEGGGTVIADETFIREAIMNPNAKVVAGYPRNVMPSFQGQISEEQLMQLVIYIRSLSEPAKNQASAPMKAAPAVQPRMH